MRLSFRGPPFLSQTRHALHHEIYLRSCGRRDPPAGNFYSKYSMVRSKMHFALNLSHDSCIWKKLTGGGVWLSCSSEQLSYLNQPKLNLTSDAAHNRRHAFIRMMYFSKILHEIRYATVDIFQVCIIKNLDIDIYSNCRLYVNLIVRLLVSNEVIKCSRGWQFRAGHSSIDDVWQIF